MTRPIQQLLLRDAHQARGVVVVMDVLRAFTSAAYAFAAGADQVIMTDDVDYAFNLKRSNDDWLLMGEVFGRPIPGFDFSNSPAELFEAQLEGRTMVQRTTLGIQGVAAATNARRLFCGNLVCATATARAVGLDEEVSYLITEGDEDKAGADLIESRRSDTECDERSIRDRVYQSRAGRQLLTDAAVGDPKDVELACDIDRFDFAIAVELTEIGFVARMVPGVRALSNY